MVNKPQDFLTLTGAARRARSEGYDITYHSLRNLVAAGYISHVPNGSRIYATNSTIRPRHPPDAGGIFEASSKQ